MKPNFIAIIFLFRKEVPPKVIGPGHHNNRNPVYSSILNRILYSYKMLQFDNNWN